MKALVAVLASMLLASCTPSEEEPVAPVPDRAAEAVPSVELGGHWRVAGIDGQPLDTPYAIALVADERAIWWEPECAGQYREYSISGDRFVAPARSSAGQLVCDIGYPAELERIWAALEAADRIERTRENGVLISGGERSLLLFSQ